MSIRLDLNKDNLLLEARYKTILKAKTLSQELYESLNNLIDRDGRLNLLIDTTDDPVSIYHEDNIVDKAGLVQDLVDDLEVQDLIDTEESILELEIFGHGYHEDEPKVNTIGLYEIGEDIDEDEDEDDEELDDIEYEEELDEVNELEEEEEELEE